jgi:YD repeat-containing protein
LIYDAASQLLGVAETDTANPAATTAWQFAYDASGNVVKRCPFRDPQRGGIYWS